MKKYFLFAAVAGMLVSCSSESLTGSDPNIEPTPTQEERVPILLSVSSPSIDVSRGTTRGTGTVGGVGVAKNHVTNVWSGQRINAFMFTKDENHATTLNLAVVDATIPSPVAYYDNAVMITPGTTENLIPGQSTATNIGEAMLADGTIQYYPSSGNFDFFGYHGAGVTSNLTKTSDPWTVDFTIDGSNDLMSTKAAPLAWGDLSAAQQAKFGDTEANYNTFITGGDFYSAKAARKLIQPVLKFNHLLTRLSFVIKAGDDSAAGWNGTAQVAGNAVNVNSIQVESKTTGNMAVAWTSAPANMITWGTATAYLPLKERPYAYENANPANLISKAAYDALLPGTPGQDDYTLTGANTNFDLIALNPTYPTVTPTVPADGTYTADETPIGEALIVAPNGNTGYNMKVNVSQFVPQNWTGTPAPAVKNQDYELVIPAPEGGFLPNTSYKVILTVYGFERIQVTTEIIPWQTGADIPVGQD